jgi:hypothetical protein
MVDVAETAWIQGLDLYAEESERIRAGYEFNTQYVDGVPAPAWLCGGVVKTNYSPAGEIVLNHYVGRRGLTMPNTERLVLSRRPLGSQSQMVWETLTHAGFGDHW